MPICLYFSRINKFFRANQAYPQIHRIPNVPTEVPSIQLCPDQGQNWQAAKWRGTQGFLFGAPCPFLRVSLLPPPVRHHSAAPHRRRPHRRRRHTTTQSSSVLTPKSLAPSVADPLLLLYWHCTVAEGRSVHPPIRSWIDLTNSWQLTQACSEESLQGPRNAEGQRRRRRDAGHPEPDAWRPPQAPEALQRGDPSTC